MTSVRKIYFEIRNYRILRLRPLLDIQMLVYFLVTIPLAFFLRSVKPDKDSIFNLTQRVVSRIEQGNVNIANYLLVEFNDRGPDMAQNVFVHRPTKDVDEFRSKNKL